MEICSLKRNSRAQIICLKRFEWNFNSNWMCANKVVIGIEWGTLRSRWVLYGSQIELLIPHILMFSYMEADYNAIRYRTRMVNLPDWGGSGGGIMGNSMSTGDEPDDGSFHHVKGKMIQLWRNGRRRKKKKRRASVGVSTARPSPDQ